MYAKDRIINSCINISKIEIPRLRPADLKPRMKIGEGLGEALAFSSLHLTCKHYVQELGTRVPRPIQNRD